MTTRADGRGGSTPPRTARQGSGSGSAPGYMTPTPVGCCGPRAPQPLPGMAWARAYGLIRNPRQRTARSLPHRPDPGFDPGYAMTTSLDDQVIIATPATADGRPGRC